MNLEKVFARESARFRKIDREISAPNALITNDCKYLIIKFVFDYYSLKLKSFRNEIRNFEFYYPDAPLEFRAQCEEAYANYVDVGEILAQLGYPVKPRTANKYTTTHRDASTLTESVAQHATKGVMTVEVDSDVSTTSANGVGVNQSSGNLKTPIRPWRSRWNVAPKGEDDCNPSSVIALNASMTSNNTESCGFRTDVMTSMPISDSSLITNGNQTRKRSNSSDQESESAKRIKLYSMALNKVTHALDTLSTTSTNAKIQLDATSTSKHNLSSSENESTPVKRKRLDSTGGTNDLDVTTSEPIPSPAKQDATHVPVDPIHRTLTQCLIQLQHPTVLQQPIDAHQIVREPLETQQSQPSNFTQIEKPRVNSGSGLDETIKPAICATHVINPIFLSYCAHLHNIANMYSANAEYVTMLNDGRIPDFFNLPEFRFNPTLDFNSIKGFALPSAPPPSSMPKNNNQLRSVSHNSNTTLNGTATASCTSPPHAP